MSKHFQAARLDNRLKPVRDVTRGIRALDRNYQETVRASAQLITDILAVENSCELRPEVSQNALEHVGRLLATSIEGRGHSLAAHGALLHAAKDPGIPSAWGDECPPAAIETGVRLVG